MCGYCLLINEQYVTEGIPAISGLEDDKPQEATMAISTVEDKKQFDVKSILFCLIVTTVGSCAVYFMAGQALKPLRTLSNEIEKIDEDNMDAMLPKVASNDEVSRLTNNFNQMLLRLKEAFVRQKCFTANAAHELKTPLAILKTGSQVMLTDSKATLNDYQEYAFNNLMTVNRLANIVDDLLLLSSIGERVEHNQEEVYLEPLFEAIVGELSKQLDDKNITVKIAVDDYVVRGYDTFLYRAFFNLIDNACKYGNDNGHIWIDAKKDGSNIVISLRDDGPGISAEHLPHIFDAFYRVDKSRSRKLGGVGLGLSIVKMMIETEGGHIVVKSDKDSGTCFVVTLLGV